MTRKPTQVLVLVALMTLFVSAFAQNSSQAPAPPAQQASGPSIMDRLKDPQQRKELQQALEVLQKAANDQAQDTKPGEHKTVGDALDKGLDMAKETVIYLAGKIEQVAPQLWRVLVMQQYVKGVTGLINPIGFLFLVWLYRRLLLKWWQPSPDDNDPKKPNFKSIDPDLPPLPTHKGWRGFFTVVVPLVAVVFGMMNLYRGLTDAAGYFINPNYYALKDIIALVKNPAGF